MQRSLKKSRTISMLGDAAGASAPNDNRYPPQDIPPPPLLNASLTYRVKSLHNTARYILELI